MKKNSIALAIVALSAPAFAGDVTVYGLLDAGYTQTSKTVTSVAGVGVKQTESAVIFSQAITSRLGVVASEDLGGGMKAIVKIETGIGSNPMGGVAQGDGNTLLSTGALKQNGTTIDATSLGGRELHATLDFGQGTALKIGFGSSPIRDFTFAYDSIYGGNFVGNPITMDATLANNRTTAISLLQQMGPVKANIGILRNENSADNTTTLKVKDGVQAGLQYTDKALSIGLAYQSAETTTGTAPAGSTTDVTTKALVFGASYDFGVLKVTAQYADVKVDDSVVNNAVGEGSRKLQSVGVSVPLGAGSLFAQIGAGKQDQVIAAGIDSVSRNITGFTVGGKYNFSKGTLAYVSFGQTELKSATSALTIANVGVKANQIALGIVKVF